MKGVNYDRFNIKCTFFFTGYFSERFPKTVQLIDKKGHEIACHGYSHEVNQAFDILSYKEQVDHLKKSKDILEQISGQEVISFRAPALRVNQNTALALAETGFKIDSSIASQRFDMFMSFGGIKKLKWLFAPRLPYRTKPDDLFRKGNGNMIEVPLSAFGFPYVGTTMRIFPLITKLQRSLLNIETKINNKPIVFDIHPNELIEEKTEKRSIERRTTNLIKYLLSDVIRGNLKVKNLGGKAIPLYISEIEFFKKKKYRFLSIKDYCEEVGLVS